MPLLYINVKLHESEARRYADMNGVLQDLTWVGEISRRALAATIDPAFRFADVEPLHVAAVVRYGRCFKGGRRTAFSLPQAWFEEFPPSLRQAHRDLLSIRNKHFAHSANDWELNAANVQLVIDRETGCARVTGINPSHARVVCLSSLQMEALRDLADRLAARVDQEMKVEAVALLALAKRIPIDELKRRMEDPPDIPGRRHVSRERRQ